MGFSYGWELDPIRISEFKPALYFYPFLKSVIIIPIVETMMLFALCRTMEVCVKRKLMICILAGIAAGLWHAYVHQPASMIVSFSFIIYSGAYFAWRKEKRALTTVATMHGLHNLVAIIPDLLYP